MRRSRPTICAEPRRPWRNKRIGFEAVSALLNHTNPSITAVYARHDFMREKREAVEAIERAILRLAIRHEASAN